MTTRVFLTGATGYIGGQVLHDLAHSSSFQIVCLVRVESKAQQVRTKFPDVQTILGSLDDVSLLAQEAEAADIVLHFAATGHAASSQAIAEGLQARHKKLNKPGYWIQISGGTAYAVEEIASARFGHPTDVTYDDTKDQDKILAILRNNPKRIVENTVLSQPSSAIKTALILGPLIYGIGKGPGNQRSIQAPEIARLTLELGHGFKLNDGENIWSNVHVEDLSNLVSLLVSAAVEGKEGLWNDDGVYNAENGEMAFKEMGTLVAKEAHAQGLIKSESELETIDAAKADSLSSHASVLWGTNAREKSSKSREKLGWSPKHSLVDEISGLVRSEAERSKQRSQI